MNCAHCGATWRARATVLGILQGLNKKAVAVPLIRPDWSRIGLGISDDINVASSLARFCSYSNSYLDSFPFLDLRNIPPVANHAFEFVSCSDVLEHIDVGIREAIQGLYNLLRFGGFAVISVPIANEYSEFYPGLVDFEIRQELVYWQDHQGRQFQDQNPEYHGGRGQNLAFRRFSEFQIKLLLGSAGFQDFATVKPSPHLGVPYIENSGVYLVRKNQSNPKSKKFINQGE